MPHSKQTKKPRLLMVYVKRSTFVKRDIEILSTDYLVRSFHFISEPKWRTVFAFISQFFWIGWYGWKTKKIVCQSSGYLSFLPSILSKVMPFKCYIIAIGTDSSKLPEIKYGHFTKPLLSFFTTVSYKMSDKILPVHKSLHKSDYEYDTILYPKQGFGNFIPSLKTEVVEVINGYKHELFKSSNSHLNRRLDFLTVAIKLNRTAYYRKGLDLILRTAKEMPNRSFTIVSEFDPIDEIPPNVKLVKNVAQEELVQIYNDHKFYLQISMFEGFPNALCEAMLCGCIPIGSSVAAIPEIIGNEGFLVKTRSSKLLTQTLNVALNSDSLLTLKPREHILSNFPIEKRFSELSKAISQ